MNAVLALALLSAMSIAPDDCVKEYLIAVNGNAMSWFCQRWDLSNRDFEAKSSMELYRTIAGDVLAGNVYDIRAFGDAETVLIKGDRARIESFVIKTRSFSERVKYVGSRDGWHTYKWLSSPTSHGIVKALVTEFKDVKPGRPHRP